MQIMHSRLLERFVGQLLPVLLTAMKKVDIDENEDDEEWGVTQATACCLSVMSKLIGDQILEAILNDVSAGIQSANWKDKYAALMIFGSVLQGPTKQFAA